jgi:hypothetical protein
LITLRFPFDAADDEEVKKRILNDDPVFPEKFV